MKKVLIITSIILTIGAISFFLLLSYEQQPTSHKHLMIDAINRGDYVTAVQHLELVDDWNFNPDKEYDWLDFNNGITFINYADSICVENIILDNFRMYVSIESQEIANYYKDIEKDYGKAIYHAELSVNLAKDVFGDRDPIYASMLCYLGGILYSIGNYNVAEKYYLEVLEICRTAWGTSNLKYAECLNDLANLYNIIGYYKQAEENLLEVLKIYKVNYGENHLGYAVALSNLGELYRVTGDYSNAEKCYLEALAIAQTTSNNKHRYYASFLENIGLLYISIGDYTLAGKYCLDALEMNRIVFGEMHPDYANSLGNMGTIYEYLKEYSKSETYYLQALEIIKTIFGNKHLYYANMLNNISGLYVSMGDFDRAEKYCEESLKIRKSVLGINHPDYAASLNNLGILYGMMGDRQQEEECYLKALEIYQFTLGKSHPKYISCLENLGDLYSVNQNYTNAEKYYRYATNFKKDHFVNSIGYMTERQRALYWKMVQDKFSYDYPRFSYLYYIQKPSISTFAYNNELFVKGLLLTSSESVKRSILESNDTTLINQWNDLTTKKQQIQVLQEKDPQSDYLKQIQDEAEQLEKEITRSSAAYRENQAMWQITWDSVQNHLSPTEMAIEYFSAPLSEDSTMYCALLLRHNSEYPELIPLFEEREISSYLSSTNKNITNKTYDFYANGDTISQLVWSKILPYINEGETIYFAPSGLLHQLAIEYLPYDENRTMSDVYNMVRLSSTREIVLNKQDTEYTTATIYGGIAYDLEEDVLLAESENYATENLLASRSIDNDTLNRGSVKYLPGTKKEAEHINTLLTKNNISAKLYTTTKANEESFKALSGKHNNILHIGTHGFTWTDSIAKKQDFFAQRMQLIGREQHYDASIDPLNRCGLLFAGANIALQGNSKDLPDGVQDGILTAKEISLMDLRDANLVVLSACETAKGDITSEGVFGLQRAFKMAGVQTIIMSLWKVNDQATQLLMTEFYNNWIGKHQSKREAFRNAQNTVRTQYEEPEYWAGFIMLD